MVHPDLSTQLKQLIKQGYSTDDIRNLVIAPRAVLEQTLSDLQFAHKRQRQQARALRCQADFAIRLRH